MTFHQTSTHVLTCPLRYLHTMMASLCDVYGHLPHDDKTPGTVHTGYATRNTADTCHRRHLKMDAQRKLFPVATKTKHSLEKTFVVPRLVASLPLEMLCRGALTCRLSMCNVFRPWLVRLPLIVEPMKVPDSYTKPNVKGTSDKIVDICREARVQPVFQQKT